MEVKAITQTAEFQAPQTQYPRNPKDSIPGTPNKHTKLCHYCFSSSTSIRFLCALFGVRHPHPSEPPFWKPQESVLFCLINGVESPFKGVQVLLLEVRRDHMGFQRMNPCWRYARQEPYTPSYLSGFKVPCIEVFCLKDKLLMEVNTQLIWRES